jgi:hypothetical protein
MAAIGVVSAVTWMRPPLLGRLVTATCGVAVLGVGARTCWQYFGVYSNAAYIRHVYQTDLRDAVAFLGDRWRHYDRIFITDQVNVTARIERPWFSFQPYIYVLLYLPVDPATFQAWEKEVMYRPPEDDFHVLTSMGPFVMSTRREFLDDHFRNRPWERALFVVRPGELQGVPVMHRILDATGDVRFEIIEVPPR